MSVTENDYELEKKIKIDFEGMGYWVMPRYVHHYIHNAYERFSLKLIKNMLDDKSTFVDIGAHYGAYSLYAAKKCGSKVIALEPVDENRELLTGNVAENKLESLITVYPYAASDKDGEAEFNIPWASDSAGFYSHPLAETIKKQKVTVRNVDGVLGDQKIDFIKIDTEGNEIKVLKGLRKTFAKNPEVKLLVEANPDCLVSAGESVESLLTALIGLDKEVYVVDEENFAFYRITDCPDRWEEYIKGYANLLCVPKTEHHFGVFVCHSVERGGGEIALIEHIENLRKRNIYAHAIVPYKEGIQSLLEEKGISHSVVTPYSFWDLPPENSGHEQNYRNTVAAGQIDAIGRRANVDFVANNTMVCPWGYLAARSLAVPLVWFIHEFGDLDHHINFAHDITEVRKFITEASDRVICCSNAVKDAFSMGSKIGKVSTVYNAMVPKDILARSQEKIDSPFQNNGLKLCLVGRVKPGKGQMVAVRAMAKLVKTQPAAELVLVGAVDPSHEREILQNIKELNLEDNVQIVGQKENPYPYMRAADVVLVCSDREAFGRVTAEAMIIGKAVVATRSGGTLEMIEEGKSGLLFEPEDSIGLAKQLQSLTDAKIKALSIQGQVEIQELFRKNQDKLAGLIRGLDFDMDRTHEAIFYTEMADGIAAAGDRAADLSRQIVEYGVMRQEFERLQDEFRKLVEQREAILHSTSWQITGPMRVAVRTGKRGLGRIRRASTDVKEMLEKNQLEKSYGAPFSSVVGTIHRKTSVKLAVVVHLYYAETWPDIRDRLKQLVDDDVEFDLFVTMPEGNKAFGREIRKTFKAAYIFIAPNQGRDVLPFLRVAKCLESLGYEYFLKLHSKRSPHRGGDGIEWFNEIVSNLLPESKRVRKDILDKLAAADTASICPAGQYISLVVNYEANSNKLKKILERSTTPELAANALAKYGDYGFAAGTMFWGRFDAIKSILDSAFTGYDFDVEKGQIDGTLAHAMERALSVVPEIEQKSLYEVGGHGVQPLKYKTDNVPDWAAEQLD